MMSQITLYKKIKILTIFLFLGLTNSAIAQKYNYSMTIGTIVLNGDTISDASNDLTIKGEFKGNTKRIQIAQLKNGATLHVEIWVNKEGVAQDKFTVCQQKYYLKENGNWRLLSVTRRLKFKEKVIDNSIYNFKDPAEGTTLQVHYKLSVQS